MPLPPALLARLQKRGIVQIESDILEPDKKSENEKSQNKLNSEPEEEVIAEDYDDPYKVSQPSIEADPTEEGEENFAIGCPNKYNIYHECTTFCHEHWGLGKKQASPTTDRKRLRMLKKYPLPKGWEEVYDPGVGRHYYWNTITDEVSWLSPSHPKAKVSLPAAKLRAIMKEAEDEDMDDQGDEDMSGSDSESDEGEEKEDLEEDIRRGHQERDRHSGRDRSGRGRRRPEDKDLDPMDPAAYSDTPRGTWSTGLERKGEAKTGADTTASGPLYQMRPYPAPGAILRMNADMKPKAKK
ncbi:poly-glutamine tract binding protein 1 [Tachypleus tridentatus]|uniref:poly-glutamine tract binding protein 1 n=1 Tax=Tachypleus tridentatus TaxID=6853 RepID=UPI003FD47998